MRALWLTCAVVLGMLVSGGCAGINRLREPAVDAELMTAPAPPPTSPADVEQESPTPGFNQEPSAAQDPQ